MSAFPDDRIPVRFGPLSAAGPRDAVLLDARLGVEAPEGVAVTRFAGGVAHRVGCACCGGRAAAAVALGELFHARATGRVPWFEAVLGVVGDARAVAEAVQSDRVAAARFRLAP